MNLLFLESHNGISSCQFDCVNITVKQSNQQESKCPLKQRGKNKIDLTQKMRECNLFSCLVLRFQHQTVFLNAYASLNKNILIYTIHFRVKRCQPHPGHALKELNLVRGQKVYTKHITSNYHSGDKTRLSPTVPFHFNEIVITNTQLHA